MDGPICATYTDLPLSIKSGVGDGYTVEYSFTADGKTTNKTLETNVSVPTYTFTPTSSEFGPLMIKSASGFLIISFTKDNTTKSFSYILCMNENIKPAITTSYEYTNRYNDKIIVGITSVSLVIDLRGLYGAAQAVRLLDTDTGNEIGYKYVAAVSDATKKTASMHIVPTKATTHLSIRVTDSRGNTAVIDRTITAYPYEPPKITASVSWNSSGKPVVAYTVAYQASIGGTSNSIKSIELWCFDSTNTRQALTSTKITDTLTFGGTFDENFSYSISMSVNDQISAIHGGIILPGKIPIMDIGSDGKSVTFFEPAPSSSDSKKVTIGGGADLEINNKSVNNLFADHVGYWYGISGKNSVDTGTNNNTYSIIPTFGKGEADTLGDFISVENHILTCRKTGVYSILFRYGYRSSAANKRAEISPFINGVREERHSFNCYTPGVMTLINTNTMIVKLNAGDTLMFKVKPIEGANVTIYGLGVDMYALDYEGKYK